MSMAMDPTGLLPICLPLLLIFILRKLLHKCPPHPFPIPPGPNPWPILGNIHQLMGSMPHIKFADLSNIYGPLISVKLGMRLVVVGSSPAVAEEILKENDRVLSTRFIPAVVPLEIHGLRRFATGFSPECRRPLFRQELFGGKVMESSARLREKKAMQMAVRSMEGTTVDVGEEAFAAILNTLSNTLMSQDLIIPGDAGAEGMSMKSLMREIMESFGEQNISYMYQILRRLDLQGRRKAKQVANKMSEIWQAIAEKKKKEMAKRE